MAELVLKKILAERAALYCQDIELGPAALEKLAPDISPAGYLDLLMQEVLFSDAVKFLARALPKRESTWWACLCSRGALDEAASESLSKALEAAERWVYEPTEEHRRQAYAAAQATGFDHPVSWAAMAAFWSGGSMAPPDVPAVPPGDDLTAKAVAGALMLAAVQTQPELAADKYCLFLRRGIDIAGGGNGRLT